MHLMQLPAGELAALLQLAMNGSSHETAQAAAHYISAQLEPEVVRGLLVTAATRQHGSAVLIMTHREVVKQHVDAPTLQRALQELIVPQHGPVLWQFMPGFLGLREPISQARLLCINAACALPAAAQLGSDAVTQLLLVALQANADDQCIQSLRMLTAASQINSDQLIEVLQAAVHFRSVQCTRMLCSLPAAQWSSSEQVAAVLLTALQQDSSKCAHAILQHLPASLRLAYDMLAPLLLAVVQAGAYDCFKLLTQAPAMASITNEDAMQLLRGVFQAPSWQYRSLDAALIVVDVYRLATPRLNSAQLTELLVAAASIELRGSGMENDEDDDDYDEDDDGDDDDDDENDGGGDDGGDDDRVESYEAAVTVLCAGCADLKDGKRLSSEQWFAVLLTAAQHANDSCIRCIRMRPVLATQLHSTLSSEQVAQLLDAAVENDSADCLFHLCLLVVEVELTCDQVVPALMVAVENDQIECLVQLCKLQAVCDLNRGSVAWLLYRSARYGSADCLELLCWLPAAEQLSTTDVVDCMTAAAQLESAIDSADCMRHLCVLPAARGLSRVQVTMVMEAAAESGSEGCTELLRQLSAAGELGGIALLLWAAEQELE
jgi:hypothetical protein